jgi:hypothetical protein
MGNAVPRYFAPGLTNWAGVGILRVSTPSHPLTTLPMFIVNTALEIARLVFYTGMHIDIHAMHESVLVTEKLVNAQLRGARRDPFNLLNHVPLKNISGGIGQLLAGVYGHITGGILMNPHEAGYPDMLPNVDAAMPWVANPTTAPFPGGFDCKGNKARTPGAVTLSSHHVNTGTALLAAWNITDENKVFINGAYFVNNIVPADWKMRGRVNPNSKTTNAASLLKTGKQKVRDGWIVKRETFL